MAMRGQSKSTLENPAEVLTVEALLPNPYGMK